MWQSSRVFIVLFDFQIENNESLLWYWATWEAAQFCVLARLRTSLGKPQDTFMSIEAVLKKYALEIQKQAEQDEAPSKTNHKKGKYEARNWCEHT